MSPVFAHGQLRLYVLALLAEAPRHGYEVIQDLEARFGGLYTPSAGTVYPRLAKLEEEGLVARSDEGRKATYRITEAGLAEVRARYREVQDLQADLDQSVRRLADEVRTSVQGRSADLRAELKAAAREARATAGPAGSQGPSGASASSGSSGPASSGPGPSWSTESARPPGSSGPSGSWGPSEPEPAEPPQDAPWPGGSGFPGFGPSWSGGSPLSGFGFGVPSKGTGAGSGDWADLERAAYEVRDQARRAWRQHGLTSEQTAELLEILVDTSRRISDVLRRTPRR